MISILFVLAACNSSMDPATTIDCYSANSDVACDRNVECDVCIDTSMDLVFWMCTNTDGVIWIASDNDGSVDIAGEVACRCYQDHLTEEECDGLGWEY